MLAFGEVITPETLLDLLQKRFPDSSRTTLREMLKADRVLVNGRVSRDARYLIVAGDRVDVRGKSDKRRLDPRLVILYEDDDLLVISKAEGLLTVANASEQAETAEALLNQYYGARANEVRVHSVHRLDYDSSGVLVFARNVDMRERLKLLFAGHDIERVYVAVVHGAMQPPAGTIRSFLAEDRSQKVRSIIDEARGKVAITHYRTVDTNERYSLLEVTLETGRRNQIRVHLSEAGHPIVGDRMYGGGLPDPLGRLGLHARRLGFIHPRTGKKMDFDVTPPRSFLSLVARKS